MQRVLLSNAFAESAGSVVVSLLWQGTVVGALVGLALVATRGRSPNLRYALACVGLLLIAALLPVNFVLVQAGLREPLPEATAEAPSTVPPAAIPESTFYPTDPTDRSDPSDSSSPAPPTRPSLSASQRYHLCLPWLGRLWAVGIVCFALYDLAGLLALRHLRTKSKAVGEDIAALACRFRERLGVRARVRVRWLAGLSSALVTGFFRTVILLPASMATRMTPDEIEAILAHEFAHIRRWDMWVNAFQRVVEALLFFHPVVWWLSKTIRAERELCCDELALRAYPDRAQYVRALLTLAEAAQSPEVLALSSHGGSLVHRVRSILGSPYEKQRTLPARIFASLLLLAVIGLPLLSIHVSGATQNLDSDRGSVEGQIKRVTFDRAEALQLIRNAERNLRNAQFTMESQVYQRSSAGKLAPTDQFSNVEGFIAPGNRAKYYVKIYASLPAVVKREGRLVETSSVRRQEIGFDGTTQTVIEYPQESFDSPRRTRVSQAKSWQGEDAHIALITNRLTHVLPFYEGMGLSAYLATIPDEAPDWKVVPSDNPSLLTIWFPHARFTPDGLQDQMSYLVTLDLARGGNIVDWKWYLDYDNGRGQLMAALEDVQLEQVEGHWLPVSFVRHEYNYDPKSGENIVREETRTKLTWSHINAELGPDAFHVEFPPSFPDTDSRTDLPSRLEDAGVTAAPGEVAWGVPVGGLQAGLMSEEASKSFRVGETVGLLLKIRNVSDEPIALEYFELALKAWFPDICDSDGTAVPVLPPVLPGVGRIRQSSLDPGETLTLDRGLLTLRPLGWKGMVTRTVAFCEGGKHKVSHTFTFGPPPYDFSTRHLRAGDLTTGELDIEIVPSKDNSEPVGDDLAFSKNDIRDVLRLLGQRERLPLRIIPSDGNTQVWEKERHIWEARCSAVAPSAIAYLEYVATDWPDTAYRAAACEALGETKREAVSGVLVECLADTSDNVRRTAARSLGNLRLEANAQPLARLLLSDPEAIVRADAACALGHIGSEKATAALVSALQHDGDNLVKQAAALALGWITDAAALPALKEALPQADGLLKDHIEAAIRNIEDPDYWGLGIKKGVPEHESVGRNEAR